MEDRHSSHALRVPCRYRVFPLRRSADNRVVNFALAGRLTIDGELHGPAEYLHQPASVLLVLRHNLSLTAGTCSCELTWNVCRCAVAQRSFRLMTDKARCATLTCAILSPVGQDPL